MNHHHQCYFIVGLKFHPILFHGILIGNKIKKTKYKINSKINETLAILLHLESSMKMFLTKLLIKHLRSHNLK